MNRHIVTRQRERERCADLRSSRAECWRRGGDALGAAGVASRLDVTVGREA